MLEVKNISYSYGPCKVLHDISFKVESGELMCVLGPNGCGKTTLLKNILGLLSPSVGSIWIDGQEIRKLSPKQLAQVMAYIPQEHTPPFPYTVFDVVLMGRTAYLASNLSVPGKKDEAIAEEALADLNITYLKDKIYTKISGGERQLVLIARALVQQPKLLVMDEPTSSLDFGKQNVVLEHARNLSRKGISILMVTHDPGHALFCADQVVTMKKGRLLKIGTPQEVISEESMQEMYGTEVKIGNICLPDERNIRVCVPVPTLTQGISA
ncbi:ABC transporter ATP-binding protein [Desulfitobacterium sp.]|uniref:ABC transporter ATP-binding protein n=1 Tax=Desulfitobacterium sp. TaxID=49981 RepID=UPI002B1FD80A|nr:ABC transporter ATP-binding protein [Desulfitobacterium sp.]MEA4902961.1 ABC transporter ATP-binding protein [Desulfitobacterium sp.]